MGYIGGYMNDYQKLMMKAEECLIKAKVFNVRKDTDMVTFWNNAYQGFVKRAHNLAVDIDEL